LLALRNALVIASQRPKNALFERAIALRASAWGGTVESSAPSGATFDIAVIGGGVNGCGIARDTAGRGWSVYLCEKNDLASSTSSASSKLIHGGLRYLEHFEFRLVREALIEREVLWRIAPHMCGRFASFCLTTRISDPRGCFE
jgi:glycerol-3-phosphate dehydrogenase